MWVRYCKRKLFWKGSSCFGPQHHSWENFGTRPVRYLTMTLDLSGFRRLCMAAQYVHTLNKHKLITSLSK